MATLLKTAPVQDTYAVNFRNTATAFAYKGKKELRKTLWVYNLLQHAWLVKTAGIFCRMALQAKLPVAGIIRKTVFQVFCGGSTLEEAKTVINVLARYKVSTVLDYAVESSSGSISCNQVREEIIHNIQVIEGLRFVSVKMSGLVPASILGKKQVDAALTTIEIAALDAAIESVDAICKVAAENKVSVFLDAEESWIQEPIDKIALNLMRKYNRQKAVVYNTFQLYRTGQLESINHFLCDAVDHDYIAGIKIVRGAYLEKEQKRAEKKGYESPVFRHKTDTDASFNEAIRICMRYLDICELCIATHNEESTQLAITLLNTSVSPRERSHVHFSQLYGMSDNLTFSLAAAGYQSSKYLPYGSVKTVMPYLIRRAEENSAIAGQMGRELSLLRSEMERRGIHRTDRIQEKY